MHIILLNIRVNAGLPNIVGQWDATSCLSAGGCAGGGCISGWHDGTTASSHSKTGSGDIHLRLYASNSSTIYGSSNTVTPTSLICKYYIRY